MRTKDLQWEDFAHALGVLSVVEHISSSLVIIFRVPIRFFSFAILLNLAARQEKRFARKISSRVLTHLHPHLQLNDRRCLLFPQNQSADGRAWKVRAGE